MDLLDLRLVNHRFRVGGGVFCVGLLVLKMVLFFFFFFADNVDLLGYAVFNHLFMKVLLLLIL